MNTDTNVEEVVLLDLPQLVTRLACSKGHLYNMIKRGEFPPAAVRLGIKFTRGRSTDIDAWLQDPAAWIAAHQERKK